MAPLRRLAVVGLVLAALVPAARADAAPTYRRVSGADRYGTAAAVSADAFPVGSPAFVATGTAFPDALAGGPAAGRQHAPVLLVTPTALPQATADELRRLRPSSITVLGGRSAVSDGVAAQLAAFTDGTVSRLSGADRFATAAAVSAATFAAGAPVAFVATGAAFPDALAAGPAGADAGGPVLLVTRDEVPAATDAELRRLAPQRIVVLGGPAAVSDAVVARLGSSTSGAVTRLSGADRYATAAAVSAASFPGTRPTVYLATGQGFPDALGAAPAAALVGGPLLLVPQGCVPAAVRDELARLDPSTVVVVGSTGVVGTAVEQGSPCDDLAAQLLGMTSSGCQAISARPYRTDAETAGSVPVCGLQGAVWFRADMDVDCDGGRTQTCQRDPSYLPETSMNDSTGRPVDAETVPYFVLPQAGDRWDFATAGIELSQVGAVIYQGRLLFAPFVDTGPVDIIGEASYAAASSLGINPDPVNGGTDGPVTYIVFTGDTGRVSPVESAAEARRVGEARAREALQANR